MDYKAARGVGRRRWLNRPDSNAHGARVLGLLSQSRRFSSETKASLECVWARQVPSFATAPPCTYASRAQAGCSTIMAAGAPLLGTGICSKSCQLMKRVGCQDTFAHSADTPQSGDLQGNCSFLEGAAV